MRLILLSPNALSLLHCLPLLYSLPAIAERGPEGRVDRALAEL